MSNDKNKYFCSAPFFQLEISPRGECRVCCKIHDPTIRDKNNKEFNVQRNTISEVWESDWLNNFRLRNINEEKRPECELCWKDEEAGIVSYRKQISNITFDTENPQLTTLILKLSNKCNCACRICNWYLSSLWQTEMLKTNRIHPSKVPEQTLKITNDNWEDWKKTLDKVDYIQVYGGEPLINDEAIQVLQYLIDSERSSQVTVALNTNATVTSKKMFGMLNQFAYVSLSFSIDDVGERYNYERWPADSESIFGELSDIHNNRKYDNIHMYLYTTISAFNILHIDEILLKFKELNNWPVNFDNIAYKPEPLSIMNLPEAVKPKVEEYLNNVNWNNNTWYRETDYRQNMINFMYLKKSPYTCEEYIRKLDELLGFDDARRNQDWRKTFSKLYELLLQQ